MIAGVGVGRRIVSNATLDSRIAAAQRVVGDSGGAQTLIRTFARKGVRFVGEVREEAKPAALAPEMAATQSSSAALQERGDQAQRGWWVRVKAGGFANNSRRIGV
jgi:DNA-binding winged helix-turn-helix (wHTH) protein